MLDDKRGVGTSEKVYVVRGIEPEHDCVEAWSVKALPFEPKGPYREMREALKLELRRLDASTDQFLHAIYASEIDAFRDAENVLFYNVGSGCFSTSAHAGLRFERAFVSFPPAPIALDQPPHHYHRYWLASQSDAFAHWNRGRTLSRWTSMPFGGVGELGNPSWVWYRVKQGICETPTRILQQTHFGLSITIRRPPGRAINLANLVKPVLDGSIAAFHAHDGTNLHLLGERLGSKIERQSAEIVAFLTDESQCIFDKRQLVRPFRENGIQWNPADDRCVAAELVIDESSTVQDWQLSGTMFEVSTQSS